MKIIAITTPKVTDEDASIIKSLVDRGIDIIHLRKPESDISECRTLLADLSAEQRAKIIIHDYPELYFEFSLKGIHINKNVTSLPLEYSGFRTRSCHTLEEVTRYKAEYDYLFLSPIYDSISKAGYKLGLSQETLRKAAADGIIDEKVIALGGVTWDKIASLKALHFGGAAMIGVIYDLDILEGIKNLRDAVELPLSCARYFSSRRTGNLAADKRSLLADKIE